MNFDYPQEAEAVREKAQAFLAEHLPAGWSGIGSLTGDEYIDFVAQWRVKLYEHGWLGLTWPTEYGGAGLSEMAAIVVAEEFARVGVPTGGPNDAFSIGMLGNTVLALGTDEQKQYFIPRILSGEDVWCQGYSEPNSGSDLASVSTKATLDETSGSSTARRSGPRLGSSLTGSSCCVARIPMSPNIVASPSCCVRWISPVSRSAPLT